jgi:purine-cytosine permease-like protein
MPQFTLKRLLVAIGWFGVSCAAFAELATGLDVASFHYANANGWAVVGGMACASFGAAFLTLFVRTRLLAALNVFGILILFILGFWFTEAICKAIPSAR